MDHARPFGGTQEQRICQLLPTIMTEPKNSLRALILTTILLVSSMAVSTVFVGAAAANEPVSVVDAGDGSGQVGPGQTVEVQRLTVSDTDGDGIDTTVRSITVRGIESATAEDITTIEVRHEGTTIGSTSPSAFHEENVTIDISGLSIQDGTAETISIHITVGESPVDDHRLQVESWVTVEESSTVVLGPVTDETADKIDSEAPFMSGAVSFVNDGVTVAGAADTIVEVRFVEPLAFRGFAPPASGDFVVLLADGTRITPDQVYDREGDVPSVNGSTVLLDLGETNPTAVASVRIADAADFHDTEGNVVEPSEVADEPVVTTSQTLSEGGPEQESAYAGERIAVVADTYDENVKITDSSGDVLAIESTEVFSQVLPLDTSNLGTNTAIRVTYEDAGSFEASHEDEVSLSDLGLRVGLAKPEFTEHETIRGDVSATAGDRDVAVIVHTKQDKEVTRSRVSLSGSGNGTFAVGSLDPGDYTLEAVDVATGIQTEEVAFRVHAVSRSGGSGPSTEASLTEDAYTEHRGDVLELGIELSGYSDYATVTIGDRASNYHAEVTVRDGDDDDDIILRFDSYSPGLGSSGSFSVPAGSEDSIERVRYVSDRGEGRTGPLAAGTYPVRVTATYSGDRTQDEATIELQPRSTTGITTWVAPDGVALSSAGEINDTTIRATSIAKGDQAILLVEASGFEGLIGAEGFSAQDLSAENQTDGTYLDIRPTGENGTSAEGIDVGSGRLVTALEHDQFFVVFDTEGDAWDPNTTYNASFVTNESSPYVADTTESVDAEMVRTAFSLVDPETTITGLNESGVLLLPPEPDAAITGTATMAPGTNFTVTVNASDDQMVDNRTVTVGDNGTWTTTVNLSGYSEGTPVTVETPFGPPQQGVVRRSPVAQGEPAFSVSNLSLSTAVVSVAEDFQVTGTVTNTGSANGTYTAELVIGGTAVSATEIFVPAGQTKAFSVDWELVTPGEYTVTLDGEQVGSVTLQEQTVTTTETTPTSTATTTTQTQPTRSMVPVYGALALLLALLGAIVFSRR